MKKARLLSNAITAGHLARDYLREAQQIRNPSTTDTRPKGQGAQDVLESLREHNRPVSVGFVPPVKTLTEVLTNDLRVMTPFMEGCGDGSIAARLFRGCRATLVGIPERTFIVDEIFWEFGEVRLVEPATGIEYVVPWDCLRLAEEQDT